MSSSVLQRLRWIFQFLFAHWAKSSQVKLNVILCVVDFNQFPQKQKAVDKPSPVIMHGKLSRIERCRRCPTSTSTWEEAWNWCRRKNHAWKSQHCNVIVGEKIKINGDGHYVVQITFSLITFQVSTRIGLFSARTKADQKVSFLLMSNILPLL